MNDEFMNWTDANFIQMSNFTHCDVMGVGLL